MYQNVSGGWGGCQRNRSGGGVDLLLPAKFWRLVPLKTNCRPPLAQVNHKWNSPNKENLINQTKNLS